MDKFVSIPTSTFLFQSSLRLMPVTICTHIARTGIIILALLVKTNVGLETGSFFFGNEPLIMGLYQKFEPR